MEAIYNRALKAAGSQRYAGSRFSFQKCIEIRKEEWNYDLILKQDNGKIIFDSNGFYLWREIEAFSK